LVEEAPAPVHPPGGYDRIRHPEIAEGPYRIARQIELDMLSWTSPRSQTSCRRALESAFRLQDLVPKAVLVGGSAVALFAALRASHDHEHDHDHDHVVADLRDRFEVLLDAVEREGPWLTNRVRPGKLILGRLGDIETGLRQLAAS